jgi:Tfp pilus assembly pilus retraction ATPase PilT
MRDGDSEGMQYFDAEIEKAVRAGAVAMEVGLSYATNPGNLKLQLADFLESQKAENEVEIMR